MKKLSTKTISILLIIIVMMVAPFSGCRGPVVTDGGEGFDLHAYEHQTSDETELIDVRGAFDDFCDRIFKDYVTMDSVTLHYTLRHPENFGIECMEPTIGEFNARSFAENEAQTRRDFEELQGFAYTELTGEQQLIYEILDHELRNDIDFYDEELLYYIAPLNTVTGQHSQLPVILVEYTFYEERDVKDYLLLLADVDRYFGELLEFERTKSERGLFMADFTADEVIKQCKDFVAHREDNFLIETFDSRIDEMDLTDEQKAAYKEESRDKVLTEVIPAYEALARGIEELKGTGENEGGICNFEKGKLYYESIVRSDVGSDKSLKELIALIEERLGGLGYNIGYILYNNEAALDFVISPDFGSTDPEEILETLRYRITEIYPDSADTKNTLKSVHPSMEESLSPAFYMTLPIDDFSEPVIYINKGSTSDEGLFPTLAHEGYPGHLYQDTYFLSTDAHHLRKVLYSMGYIEGWATYGEMNSYMFADFPAMERDVSPADYPAMRRDVAMLLGFDEEFGLALQTRCDIGVNYEGWTEKEIMEFFDLYGIGDEAGSRRMFEHVIGKPGNTLKYYIGYLEFDGLYNYASGELGDAFSYRAFHERLLDMGPVPFFLLKKAVDEYIAFSGGDDALSPAA